jgi:predicted ribosomally synthesized peptide with SipW-like signal peptide
MNKKIILSLSVIGAVAAIAVGGTIAYFSDTETSTGNTFTAGSIDLKFQQGSGATWADVADQSLFVLGDMKPGDIGEKTIKLAVDNNPACGSIDVNMYEDLDNTCTEPEGKAENPSVPGCDQDGELNDNVSFFIWRETDCDNVYEAGEIPLTTGTLTENRTYQIGELPTTADPAVCYGIAYCFGVFDTQAMTCNGAAVGNESQSDSFKGDITITATQKRNQYPNGCPGTQFLFLENETPNAQGPWTPITNDEIYGLLTWQGDGNTFDYTLSATGLPANTGYSLIYYADPYAGNHPGALIGTGTTNGSGNINFSGNPDLGIDLPTVGDANYATGAKIWLIPSVNYNASTKEVTPWTPDTTTWLFEGNVYIHYDDTNN